MCLDDLDGCISEQQDDVDLSGADLQGTKFHRVSLHQVGVASHLALGPGWAVVQHQ